MQYTAVTFDLDGTLLDTLADIAEAGNHALAACGLPTHPVDRYRDWVGKGLRRLCEQVIPPGDDWQRMTEKCIGEFRRAYGEAWNVRTRAYDGVEELLDALAALNVPMAVLSNKPHDFVQACVDEFFPHVPFGAVLGEGDGVPPKPDPTGTRMIVERFGVPAEQFVYLGDTPTDMATAAAAGMLPVGVSWGFRPVEELESAGARHIIGEPRELIALMEGRG